MVKYPGGALLPSLKIERESRVPLSRQMTAALRDLIVSGALSPGQRLPSSRTLARDQGVSRTTVINVYEQLTAEGLIASRVGAGAYVRAELAEDRPAPVAPAPAAPVAAPRLAQLSAEASEQYFPRLDHPASPRAFTTGMAAFDEFPMALWSRLAARYWRQPAHEVLGYPEAEGLSALRRAVVGHLQANRGISCTADQVIIFNGAQDAFNRIANTLLDPGDVVWFENPGAIGARNALISGGARLAPLPVDDQGIDVAAGRRLAPNFRLAFVTPAHQHPLGVTMTVDRRQELLAAAEAAGAWVVEDDYVGEFHYGARPPPTLKSADAAGRVIYVGTFSKTLFAALRLGFIVAPAELAPVFRRVAGATMQGAPASLQSIVADFIEEGHFAAHIRRMRGVYAARQQALMDAAATHLDELMQVVPTDTGFQTLGRLAPGLEERAVSAKLAEAGITAAPVSRFAIEDVAQKGLILGFSAVPPRAIERGVQTMARVLRGMKS